METKRICPSCQKPLATDVPMGLCPECLVKAGFPSVAETESGVPHPMFAPPPVEELARNFPQLEITELIGKGGMGAVYKARQPKLNRVVALKILPPAISETPAFAQRFTREAQALAQLSHPGIVTLYEFGEANGLFYFLMEYVDGVTLRQLLHAGRVSPREALAIVPQICDALQYAHDQGIVHRDIKPENILLDRRGRVKVADFGLAKIVANQGDEKPTGGETVQSTFALTDITKVMGTPNYMSPEQISAPGQVDHRTDIYALGVVFYQMLTGELPGRNLEPPSRKIQLDVRLDDVVLRALEKEPELRYQQASILKTHVENIVGNLSEGGGQEGDSGNIGDEASHTLPPLNPGPPPPPPIPPTPPASPVSGNGDRRFIAPAVGLILAGVLTVFGMLASGAIMGIAAYQLNKRAEIGATWIQAKIQSTQSQLNRRREGKAALEAQIADLAKDTSPAAMEMRHRHLEYAKDEAEVGIKRAETELAQLREEEKAIQGLSPRAKWGALAYVGPVAILAGLLSGALTITGAVKMLRRKRRWGLVASILGIITPPGFILGLPFGIWALMVLSQRSQSDPDGTNDRSPVSTPHGTASSASTSAKRQLLPPAIGLILSGVLTVLSMLAGGSLLGIAAYQFNKHAQQMAIQFNANAQAEEARLAQLRKLNAELQAQIDQSAKDSPEVIGVMVKQRNVVEEIAETEVRLDSLRERSKRSLGPRLPIQNFGGDEDFLFWFAPLLVVGFVFGILTIVGAIQMLRQHRRWGMTASILGMITPPGLLLGLPFGIWALIILSQKNEQMPRDDDTNAPPPGIDAVGARFRCEIGELACRRASRRQNAL